jgi:hypothetical protein
VSLLPCSALPFIEIKPLAHKPVLPLQDCYSIHKRDGGQKTWSMIGSDYCKFPAPLLNRDEEDKQDCPPSNGTVSAETDIFILTTDLWKFNNWISSN